MNEGIFERGIPTYEALAANVAFHKALDQEIEAQKVSAEKADAIRLAAQNQNIVLSDNPENDAKLFLKSMLGMSGAELDAASQQKTQADAARQQAEIDEKFKAAGIPQDHE